MDFIKPSRSVTLNAKPEPIEIDLRRTAVIVVDMQNAFVSKGGMFDISGRDISAAEGVIENNRKIIDAARKSGCRIVYLKMSYDPDYSNSWRARISQLAQGIGFGHDEKKSRILGEICYQGNLG